MDDRISVLERRGRRLRYNGEFRKAANAYGELTAIDPLATRYWVLLGVMLQRANRTDQAMKALRQAIYLLRREDRLDCARSVQRVLSGYAEASAEAA